jgi:transcriptional regulator
VYVPPYFEVTDRKWVLDLIERYPFGLLITAGAEFPRVSHIPLIARERADGLWIVGHVARANPHAQAILEESPATIVFQGAHAYVSASWYEEPYRTVPTWNYAAAHLCGRLRPADGANAVKLLSLAMEGTSPGAWDPERLGAEYFAGQLRAIVAFELRADVIYGTAKLSQNRTTADRLRVIERLAASSDQVDRECAGAMLAALSPPIAGEALRLRAYTAADRSEVRNLLMDADVMRFVGEGRPMEESAASAMLDKIQKKYRTDPSFHIWAIEEAGRYAGHAELKRRTGRLEYELVYMLRKDSWGRSLGGRVVDALIAEAKDRDIPFVIATVHPENAASIAILRRRGFALDEALTRELDVTAYRRELA